MERGEALLRGEVFSSDEIRNQTAFSKVELRKLRPLCAKARGIRSSQKRRGRLIQSQQGCTRVSTSVLSIHPREFSGNDLE